MQFVPRGVTSVWNKSVSQTFLLGKDGTGYHEWCNKACVGERNCMLHISNRGIQVFHIIFVQNTVRKMFKGANSSVRMGQSKVKTHT